MNLSDTLHHTSSRRPCAGCGARVYTYATTTDDDGHELAWYCTMCADRLRGRTLCEQCRRPIAQNEDGEWRHAVPTVFAIRHPAAPEVVAL